MIFKKLCASGNDFLIFTAFKKQDFSRLAQKVCNRTYGFGADGLIVILPHGELDFEWLFYNSDGSGADMCGNGARAAALYANIQNLAPLSQKFLTGAGIISAQIFDNNFVEVALTKPNILQTDASGYVKIDTGVPHLVKQVSDISEFDLKEASKLRYEHNANVNIYQIKNGEILVRTYERGVEDETLACGTGMSACVYDAMSKENFKLSSYTAIPKSKERLSISLKDGILYFKGAVTIVGECISVD